MSGKINGEPINEYYDLPIPFLDDLSPVIAPLADGRRQAFMSTEFEFLDESTLTMDYLLLGGDHGVTTAPATPNFSMSSASTELGAEEDSLLQYCKKEKLVKHDAEEDDEKKHTKGISNSRKADKQLTIKNRGEKRQREARFAFMIKSEVDHLEDGYRWRKYGQKAVKNSTYPRSYYRCTAETCNVKKRVERSHQDPATVITTYEGRHNHSSPTTPRSSSLMAMVPPANFGGDNIMLQRAVCRGNYTERSINNKSVHGVHLASLPSPSPLQQLQLPAAADDYGLLQDILSTAAPAAANEATQLH
ncbi:WRKY transcription factor 71-like [Curcuma longa]|uniref:WRKY transcription factor 71-like n=1 Tax=Curcuma longa TaxID=136217 RepID=UPI003D9DEC10